MRCILLGWQSGMSKKGNPYLKLSCAIPYSAKAVHNGAVGNFVTDKFTNVTCVNQLNEKMLLKEIEFEYGTSEYGFPEIVGVKLAH